MTEAVVERGWVLVEADAQWLEQALNQLGLCVRAWQRILKVAMTIADLAGENRIQREHLMEAVSYRGMDRLLLHLQKDIE